MGKSVENPKKPKKHIISCRISDDEMEALQVIASSKGQNISDLIRQTIFALQSTVRQAA